MPPRQLIVIAAALLPNCGAFAPSMQLWGGPANGLVSRRAALRGVGASIPCILAGGSRPACAQLYVPSDGSELAPIAKDGKPSPVLLVPLLQAQQQLERVAELIESAELASWRKAKAVLGSKPFAPSKELKRLFNAYSDNIYFDGSSSRRNMYLDGSAMLGQAKSTFGFGTLAVGAGGASPESKDTMTYLYRNEVLNNVDALSAELAYLIKQADAGVPESNDDLFMYLEKAMDNFDKYLSNIDKQDVAKAREYVSSRAQ